MSNNKFQTNLVKFYTKKCQIHYKSGIKFKRGYKNLAIIFAFKKYFT